MEWTAKQKRIAQFLQHDLPLEQYPFKSLEAGEEISEEEVLLMIRDLEEKKIIRKFAAFVRHTQVGFSRNAMVIWAVSEERSDAAGNLFAGFKEVTHCYLRTPPFAGRYNLFTMIHQKDIPLETILQNMANAASVTDYLVLETTEELKKTSMEYF
ncbi:MAG: Lrp/AsnC family transcriptional regulator [Syntrophobacterales bacterium]|nr:Lrp/AsnC family transcriptional regulator [Syntrophobacterales bacterium]